MNSLQERIGYRFHDGDLLALALTHPSAGRGKSNQRLEFLGDAVLGAVVARLLYDAYPAEQEGELARRLAALVRGETLTAVARGIGLGETLTLSAGERRDTASNLEDALEALIGAVYLDGGMAAAEAFILSRWTELSRNIVVPPKDAKTSLQEWAQARTLPVPVYALIESTGPAHAPQFTIEVTVQGYPPAQAQAASKKLAEQAAAEKLLETLQHG
ncbi:MAG: ribonuclease III [Pseudomonadota bacterium]|nr:ribonuclease III [Pseudomonadota bacterium]